MPLSRLYRFFLPVAVALAGCSTSTHAPYTSSVVPATGYQGALHGGQQPIVGATINVYTVGTTGDGAGGGSVLTGAVTTDSSGFFDLTGKINCASSTELLYLVATGGGSGSYTPPGNQQSILITALGPCNNPSGITFINVNEVTTVAAIYALAPYMTSPTAIGSGASDAAALSNAFTLAWEFANVNTGSAPGVNVPTGTTVPIAQIDTLANLLSACVNSNGGVAGDTSICGQLFTLLTPTSGAHPTDTAMALRNLALNPGLNTQGLYDLILPTVPFQPTITQQPPDFGVRLTVPSDFTVSPSLLSFGSVIVGESSSSQTVTVANNSTNTYGVSSYNFVGPAATDYALGPGFTCPQPYIPGATCQLPITFIPSAAGVRLAYLVIKNLSPNPYIVVTLTGTGAPGSAGPISVSPSSLHFTLYDTPQLVTLTNSGNTPLHIQGISLTTNGYIQTNNCGSTLAAQSICTISVSALSGGFELDTLTIADDASSGAQTVSITTTRPGYMPPQSIDFGQQSLTTQGMYTIQPSGSSQGPVNLSLTGTNAADFSFSSTGPLSTQSCGYLVQGTTYSCVFSLYFNPSATGTRTATVHMDGVGNIPVTGTGVGSGPYFELNSDIQPFVPATSLSFSTAVGAPATQSLYVRYTGTASNAIGVPVVAGPNASHFTGTSNCSGAPQTTCTLTLTYDGSTAQTFTTTATISDATNTIQKTITINATSASSASAISASPTSLTFAKTLAGTVTAPQSTTITTYANNPINSHIVTGPFIITQGASCTTNPCQVSVEFAPAANASAGSITGQLVSLDPNSGGGASIYLYGSVAVQTTISISPNSYTFPLRSVSTTSIPQTFTISNSGTNTLLFTSISLAGANPGDYVLTNNCTSPVTAGNSCTLGVSFSPQASGTRTASVQIVSNSTTSTDSITLSGTAQ